MKYLQNLCHQTGVKLSIKWYLPYLNQAEINLLMKAKEKSERYQLNLLKALSLSILFQLQHAEFIWGEAQWMALIAKCQSDLMSSASHVHRLRTALRQADEVIEAAGITEEVRHKLWDEVKRQSLLSEAQTQDYESARQACLKSQAVVNDIENQVDLCVNEYAQISQETLSPVICFSEPDPREFPHPLHKYDYQFHKERLSRKNIFHQIWCEKDARVVYCSLAKELLQKPTFKKLTECIDQAKNFLTHRAIHIMEKSKNSNQTITQHTKYAIDHRTQVLLAHANKIEQIALQLAIIIQILQPYANSQNLHLLNFMMDAKAMQKILISDEKTSSRDLQNRLLSMEFYRDHYEKSIHSIWNTLSYNRKNRGLQRQINLQLQTIIANLVIPICGFEDRNTVILPEKVKQFKSISDRLVTQQNRMHQEKEKIQEIKNIII